MIALKNKCEECGKCCLDTEMTLSLKDIQLIIDSSNIPLNKDAFVERTTENLYQLKNIDGHCVFLDANSKLCKIYEFRPQGCRFYPMIYNLTIKKCVLDKECPRTHLFYQYPQDFKAICSKLKIFVQDQLNLKS